MRAARSALGGAAVRTHQFIAEKISEEITSHPLHSWGIVSESSHPQGDLCQKGKVLHTEGISVKRWGNTTQAETMTTVNLFYHPAVAALLLCV